MTEWAAMLQLHAPLKFCLQCSCTGGAQGACMALSLYKQRKDSKHMTLYCISTNENLTNYSYIFPKMLFFFFTFRSCMYFNDVPSNSWTTSSLVCIMVHCQRGHDRITADRSLEDSSNNVCCKLSYWLKHRGMLTIYHQIGTAFNNVCRGPN